MVDSYDCKDCCSMTKTVQMIKLHQLRLMFVCMFLSHCSSERSWGS